MPHAHAHDDLDAFIAGDAPRQGLLGQHARLHGQPAEGVVGRRGDRRERLLLRLPAAADRQPQHLRHRDGADRRAPSRATSCSGRTRPSARPTRACSGSGWRKLDWLVVRDFSLIERATWWKDGPEIESGEMRTEDIATEVFFFPAAAHTEKDGTFTNTQRMLQWHHKAVEPPDDQRSDLWFTYHLGRRIRERLAGSADERDRPLLDLTWDYPTEGEHDEPERRGGAARDQRLRRRRRAAVGATPSCEADGSTACGCWIYCGCYADGVNQTARRKPAQRAELDRRRVGVGVAGKPPHPLQPRLGRSRGPAVERAQGARLVGRRAAASGPATTCPTSRSTSRRTTGRPAGATGPDAIAGDEPFIMQADGRGWLYAPAGVAEGRCRRTTSRRTRRSATCLHGRQRNPARQLYAHEDNRYHPDPGDAGADVFPFVAHHLPADRALHRRRHVALDAVPGRAAARALLRGLAGAGRRARARARAAGRRSSARAARSRRACWSPTA